MTMTLERYNADKHFNILKNWYTDSKTLLDMGLDPMDEEELYRWLNEPDRIHLIFFQDEAPVGCVNFYHHKTKFPNYEIGYLVDVSFQGKGLATEMVRESLEYAKSTLSVQRIEEVYVKGSNTGSKRVLEKNGFQLDRYSAEKDRYYFSKVL
jgi:RimJ/RimL family protein N-acetyltransferase